MIEVGGMFSWSPSHTRRCQQFPYLINVDRTPGLVIGKSLVHDDEAAANGQNEGKSGVEDLEKKVC